jgi:hypothetical protein
LQHAIDVAEDIVVPVPNNQVSHLFKCRSSANVRMRLPLVLSTIDLHDKSGIGTQKVDHESTDRNLALEFQTGEPPVTETKPQPPFGIGLALPQLTSDFRSSFHPPPHPPSARINSGAWLPLPTGERERSSMQFNKNGCP